MNDNDLVITWPAVELAHPSCPKCGFPFKRPEQMLTPITAPITVQCRECNITVKAAFWMTQW